MRRAVRCLRRALADKARRLDLLMQLRAFAGPRTDEVLLAGIECAKNALDSDDVSAATHALYRLPAIRGAHDEYRRTQDIHELDRALRILLVP